MKVDPDGGYCAVECKKPLPRRKDLCGRFSTNLEIHGSDRILDDHWMVQADLDGFRRRVLTKASR